MRHFQDGHLEGCVGEFTVTGTITWTVPVLLFCIAFGMAMDYTYVMDTRDTEVGPVPVRAVHTAALALAAGGQTRERDARRAGRTRRGRCSTTGHSPAASSPGSSAGTRPPGSRCAAEARELRTALFPTAEAAYVHRLLFGLYTGILPDAINSLSVGDLRWSGKTAVLLDHVKGRAGPESSNLPRRAVRVLEQWLALSEPLRRHTSEEFAGDLWLGLRRTRDRDGLVYRAMPPPDCGALTRHRRLIGEAVGSDAGGRLFLHASRIRTTYFNQVSRRGRSWTGDVPIDPNHTPGVEGDHYLTATTPAQKSAVAAIIEDAQGDIVRRALPPRVLDLDEAAEFTGRLPEAVKNLGLDHGALKELLSGEQDVFTASCTDVFAGLHGPKGAPCPARPWVCLMCPLAVYVPRHVPNLLRLKAYFSRQARSMTAGEFVAVFGPYADRLDREILPRFRPAVLRRAASQVRDRDDELPLRPEESTA
ncbi:hypothetical protein AB0P45_10245 [Streptomyces niveus]|uniref:hypothetical protein n=1 Tax=Streptomyces niveus TaxID=193462 RepID=UPI00343F55E1